MGTGGEPPLPSRQLPLHRQCSGSSWGAILTFFRGFLRQKWFVWHVFEATKVSKNGFVLVWLSRYFEDIRSDAWCCFCLRQLVHLLRWMIWTPKHQSSKRRTAPQRFHRQKTSKEPSRQSNLKDFIATGHEAMAMYGELVGEDLVFDPNPVWAVDPETA